jgi:dihydropteroate synthase
MAVLNVTPDSFSDGGCFQDFNLALARATEMIAQGADIIDVGGESTRPGAVQVSVEEELQRVVPVIEAIHCQHPQVIISVDTSKPEVMTAAVKAGANLINDVRALTLPGALEAAADTQAAVCLMHMQGQPQSMQAAPRYDHVIDEVNDFLSARVQACISVSIARERLVLDPGIGFGKTLEHNLALLAHLPALMTQGLPLLVGVSRKSMIGTLLNRTVEQRLSGSVALAAASVLAGARIIRAHDVSETYDAVRMAHALLTAGYGLDHSKKN